MKELFGAPMSDVLLVVVVLLIISAALVSVLAWRNPLLFKIGLRNIPRRRAQTALIAIGLMLSTLLISSAFATGDTLSSSLRNLAFEITGPIDHIVQFDTDAGRSVAQRDAVVPQQIADDLQQEFAEDEDIEQFVRVMFDAVSMENLDKGQSEPLVFTLGLDPDEVDAVGGIPRLRGGKIQLADLPPNGIVLNESAADLLAAETGDRVRLRVLGRLQEFQVFDIAEDTLLSGKVNPADPQGGVIRLEDAQQIFQQEGRLTGIGVTAGGVDRSDDVEARLNRFFELKAQDEVLGGIEGDDRVYADDLGRPQFEAAPFKKDTVDDAEAFGSIFTSFFLVMGLFAIAAGLLLILLIFVMLAQERKTEMGISRAVGMQRSQLVQAFLAEGIAYNLGAAVIGTVAGILISFGMVAVLESAFDDFGITFTQHIEPRSVVVAAGLGILLTLIVVVVSSFVVSQLNIVAAIRDIPDDRARDRRRISVPGVVTTTVGLILTATIFIPVINAVVGFVALNLPGLGAAIRRRGWGEWVVISTWRLMRWRQEWWFVLLLLGAIAVLLGLDSESAFFYLLGLSLITIGLVLLARRLNLAGRAAYSLMGLAILFFWLAPRDWHTEVWGKEFEGGIEMFVLSGIMMVTSATVFVIFNLDLLIEPIRWIGRAFGRFAPAVRTAVAYPTTARYRTGMTVAMIAIIMFALVTFTTINRNFAAAFTSDAAAGGFDVQVDSTINDELSDLRAALIEAEADDLARNLETITRLRIGSVLGTDVLTLESERWNALDDRPIRDESGEPIFDPASSSGDRSTSQLTFLTGADDAFLVENRVPLQARAVGFESDGEVWDALRDPGNNFAVVTFNAVVQDDFGGFEDASFEMPDVIDEESTRAPRVRVQLRNGDRTTEVTIIGVVSQVAGVTEPTFPFLPSIITHDEILAGLYDKVDVTRHLAGVGPGVDPLETARAIEATLNVQAFSIIDELEDQQAQFDAILKLFQGFTGLGLLVGIAALGVIAWRAVVERRQQIGVLRAIGYRRGMVRLEMLLEMGFIAALGIGIGIALALALAWRLFDEQTFGGFGGIAFQIPVVEIVIFAAAAQTGALLMTYLPARQAARLPPAEALRYE